MLAYAAVLMAWSSAATLGDELDDARRCLAGMFPSRRRVGKSYQGFINALVKHTPAILLAIQQHLRSVMQEMAGAHWLVEGWLTFAVDGSRIDAPRTAANELAFGGGRKSKRKSKSRSTSKDQPKSKGKEGPKQWLTTLIHMGLSLPWDWRTGPGDDSERHHLRQMLGALPMGCLLVADAGFTGYELLSALMSGGRHLLIRVGSNVRLLTELGYDVRECNGVVYLWPQDQRKTCPPLVLRLIVLHDGRRNVYLLTDVLDERALSDAAAGRLYRRRWGVEVFYRSLKATLARRKMRSAAPRHARVELHWTMVGLWLLGLMSVRAILQSGGDPHRLSIATALRSVRRAMLRPRHVGTLGRLRHALLDSYTRLRPKAARHWPHKKTDRPPGPPHIRNATPTEVQAAQELARLQPAA